MRRELRTSEMESCSPELEAWTGAGNVGRQEGNSRRRLGLEKVFEQRAGRKIKPNELTRSLFDAF